MQYLWNSGSEVKIHELQEDYFLRDMAGEYLKGIHHDANCAYTFDVCIVAAFAMSCIIVNTPALYELDDSFKQAMQQAAALMMMVETNTEEGYSRREKLRSLVENHHDQLLHAVLFSDRLNILHDTNFSLIGAVTDATKIAIMLMPEPRMHVLNAGTWAVTKHNVEMASLTLSTYTARELYETFIVSWSQGIAGNKPYVNPTTLRILEQQNIIAKAQEEIVKISDACAHPEDKVIEELKGDTGNWSQSDDSYSKKRACTLCGRHWYWNQNHGERDYKLLSTSQHQLPIKT